jgi:hypothetical protein
MIKESRRGKHIGFILVLLYKLIVSNSKLHGTVFKKLSVINKTIHNKENFEAILKKNVDNYVKQESNISNFLFS